MPHSSNELDAVMNDSQRSGEVNLIVEVISSSLIHQGDNEPMDVPSADRLECGASKTVTVVYIACPRFNVS